jgi:hypothetical protein
MAEPSKTDAKAIQQRLTDLGLLDPPPDEVLGSVSRWALGECGITEEVTSANADEILDGVMQQGGNRHVLGTLVFEHRRSDREQVCDVGHRSRFADLATVNVSGIQQGSVKSIG